MFTNKIKYMVLMNTNITKYYADNYGSEINKLVIHLPHGAILWTNFYGKAICEAFERRHMFMDVRIHHDYEERLFFNFAIKYNLNTMEGTGLFPLRVLLWTTLNVKEENS